MFKKGILLLVLMIFMSGCLKETEELKSSIAETDSESESESESELTEELGSLSMKYSNQSVSDTVNTMETALPLAFGVAGVNGWYYRPGAGPVTAFGPDNKKVNNINSTDWSLWDMLPIGGVAANFILQSGQDMDIQQLSGPYWLQSITKEYAKNVGRFRFDFLFIEGSPSVVIADVANSGTYNFSGIPLYNGQPLGGIGPIIGLLARKDWFPDPVVLTMTIGRNGSVNCYTADTSLSAFQLEIIDSLFAQKTHWPAGIYRRDGCPFNPLVGGVVPFIVPIAPFKSHVPIVKFTTTKEPQEPIVTPEGNVIPQPPQVIIGSNLQATVSFNLYPSDIRNWNNVSTPSYNYPACSTGGGCNNPDGSFTYGFSPDGLKWYGHQFLDMRPSTTGVPWGMSIDFSKEKNN